MKSSYWTRGKGEGGLKSAARKHKGCCFQPLAKCKRRRRLLEGLSESKKDSLRASFSEIWGVTCPVITNLWER